MGWLSRIFGGKAGAEKQAPAPADDLSFLETPPAPTLSLGREDEQAARRLFSITGSLGHYGAMNPKAADNIRREVRALGESLAASGGRERMERVALRVRVLGARPAVWEPLWNGIHGWGEAPRKPDGSDEDRVYLEAPSLEPKRAALLQLDAARLKALAGALPASGSHTFTLDSEGRPLTFSFARGDLEWAARVAEVLDQADALGNQKRFKEAIGAYKEGLRSAPGFPILLMSLGVCYFRIGDRKKGLRYLERAAELSPRDPRIRKNLDAARGA